MPGEFEKELTKKQMAERAAQNTAGGRQHEGGVVPDPKPIVIQREMPPSLKEIAAKQTAQRAQSTVAQREAAANQRNNEEKQKGLEKTQGYIETRDNRIDDTPKDPDSGALSRFKKRRG